ncbi:MaoC family dehydratase [Streptomyces aureoversilis]|uniref:MaoC family dehydratase n=1 Tax=Streptomyces aureoversilis TaxID=67277 RepID=A0ABW0A430_9ACTN
MAARISYDEVEIGTELPARSFPVTRADLVRYAGASGDFNPIHWNEKFAKEVGLPDVIAHGMFTMAEAGRVVTDWAGDPGAVAEYGVRFTRPVVVPNDDKGAVIEVTAKVAAKDDERRTVRVDLVVKSEGQKVLGMSRAVVRLA